MIVSYSTCSFEPYGRDGTKNNTATFRATEVWALWGDRGTGSYLPDHMCTGRSIFFFLSFSLLPFISLYF